MSASGTTDDLNGKIVSVAELRIYVKKAGLDPDKLAETSLRRLVSDKTPNHELLDLLLAQITAGTYIYAEKAQEIEKSALKPGKKEEARKAFSDAVKQQHNLSFVEIKPWVEAVSRLLPNMAQGFEQAARQCDEHREKLGTSLRRLETVKYDVNVKINAKFRHRLDRFRGY